MKINAPFAPTRRYYADYERDLKRISVKVGELISKTRIRSKEDLQRLIDSLLSYTKKVEQWSGKVAENMVDKLNSANLSDWQKHSQKLSKRLRQEVQSDKVSGIIDNLMREQKFWISTLPGDAADKIQKYMMEATIRGERWETLADKILKIPGMNYRRAKLIARTEGAKAASILTQARAESIGCTHFIWRAVLDNRTRPSHRAMNGHVCEYARPPIVEGLPLIPGQTYNCRCHAEPIIDEDLL